MAFHELQSLIFQMVCCDCLSKPKQERKKRDKPYSKVNAYTQPFSCQQIMTVLIVLTQITLHSVFIVPALPEIGSTVLWVMMGYFYAVLLFIINDYIKLTTFDPVDPLVQNQELAVNQGVGELKFCLLCDCQVHESSYHCRRCHRCTVQFDHHCTFLNNCIGSRNYESFFRLLLTYTSFCADAIAMGIWTATKTFRNGQITFEGAQWGMIASAALSLVSFAAVGCLLAFHCYITCCEYTTTYNLNHSPENDPALSERVNIRQNAPASSRMLQLQNRFS